MNCLYCGSKTAVKNSRFQKRSNNVWRRRQCLNCKTTFTTHETPELSSTLFVDIKGSPTPFLADKLFVELLMALQDHKNLYIAAREVTNTVIKDLMRLSDKPFFTPKQISQSVSKVLKRFDSRAWLRYVAEHPSIQP